MTTSRVRRFATSSILAAALLMTPLAASADGEAARNFVRGLADEAISIVSAPVLSRALFEAEFGRFIDEGFNTQVVGRSALGRYWRIANEEQRAAYQDAFFGYIVKTYASRFKQYAGESFEVNGVREINEAEAIVSSVIVRPESTDVTVDWHVLQSGDEYQIVDVIIEGLRIGITLRDQFSAAIRANGGSIDRLIEELRLRSQRPADGDT
jgi:phospholipid transport system substrate-binding protein